METNNNIYGENSHLLTLRLYREFEFLPIVIVKDNVLVHSASITSEGNILDSEGTYTSLQTFIDHSKDVLNIDDGLTVIQGKQSLDVLGLHLDNNPFEQYNDYILDSVDVIVQSLK